VDPLSLVVAALLATTPVTVTEDDLTLPAGCRPSQAVRALQHHVGPAVHFDEVIVGYANGLGQLEFSASAAGTLAHGKGAMDCATGQIVAFGLGYGSERDARLCPPARTHATVACVRHWA
jgi:hypothetical protein